MSTYLFTNATANGDSASYSHIGGQLAIWAYGSFGGGTLTMTVNTPDGTAWIPADSSSTTAPAFKVAWMPPCQIRFNLAASSGANISVAVSPA